MDTSVQTSPSAGVKKTTNHQRSDSFQLAVRLPNKLPSWIWNLCGRLWEEPCIRTSWNDAKSMEDRKYDFFFDLIFVAFAANMSLVLRNDLTGSGIGSLLVYYITFFAAWYQLNMFTSRFSAKGGFVITVKFMYAMCILGMAGCVIRAEDLRLQYSLYIFISRICLIVLYGVCYALIPSSREFSVVAMFGHSMSAVFMIIAGFMPSAASKVVWSSLWVIDYVWERASTKLEHGQMPINHEHMVSRLYDWMYLMVGQAAIAFIFGVDISSGHDLGCVFFGFVLIFTLKGLYYQAQPYDTEQHALKHSKWSGRGFLVAHIFLGACMVATGTGIRFMIDLEDNERIGRSEYWTISSSVFFTLVAINLIRACHGFKKKLHSVWFVRVLVLILTFLIPTMGPAMGGVEVLFVHSILCGFLLLVNLAFSEAPSREWKDIVLFKMDTIPEQTS